MWDSTFKGCSVATNVAHKRKCLCFGLIIEYLRISDKEKTEYIRYQSISHKQFKRVFLMKFIQFVLLFFCALFLSCLTITLNYSILNSSIPSDWEGDAVIILCDSVEYELKKGMSGNLLTTTRVVYYRINNHNPAYLRELDFSYNKYMGGKPELSIMAVYNDGKMKNIFDYVWKGDHVYLYSLYANKPGDVFCNIDIPDYKNVKYIRTEEKRKVKRCEHFGRIYSRWGYRVLRKNIVLKWPKNYSLNYGLVNKEKIKTQETKKIIDNKNVYTLELQNLEAIKNQSKYPENYYATLNISFPPEGTKSYTWEQLGDHYLELLKDSLINKDNFVVDSIAQEISGANESEIIKNAYNWVKDNIRYYGSWEESYGWIPRDSKVICNNGYGDCKEMALLLQNILKAKSIDACLTLVKTDGFQIVNKYPTLDIFNHMIVCVEKNDGTKLFLDATVKKSTYLSSYYRESNQKVLILKEKGSCFDVIHPHQGYRNQILTESEIAVAENDSWKIKGMVQFTGEIGEDIYWKIKTNRQNDQQIVLINILKDIVKINPRNITIIKNNIDEVKISYVADFNECVLLSPEKGLVLDVPAIYTPVYEYSDLTYEGDRFLTHISQKDTWRFPREFGNFSVTMFKSKYGDGSWKTTNNSITRTYSCAFNRIDNSERSELKDFFTERSKFARGIRWSKN